MQVPFQAPPSIGNWEKMLRTTRQATSERHRHRATPDWHDSRRPVGRCRTAPRSATLVAAGGAVLVALTGFTGSLASGTDTTSSPSGATPARTLVDGPDAARAEQSEAEPARSTAQASRNTARAELDVEPAPAPEPDRVVMPLESGTYEATSPYGDRTDPVTGVASKHHGSDMAAPIDTPIHAIADGVVTHVGPGIDGRSDMLIIIEHDIDGQVVSSWYNHMYRDGLYVERGQEVSAGEVIGAVGSNGKSTGPHLHLEIHIDDELTTTDPVAWLAEHGAVDVTTL